MKQDFTPYFIRLGVVALLAIGVAFLINEGAYFLQRDKIDRAPRIVQLVIPAGTAERVEQGQPAPGIPDKMTFIVGDVLEVKNEDVQPHQLGPIWVPPGTTGSLALKEVNRFSFSCSFAPDRYLGLDVRQTAGFATRLTGLMISAPTLAIFLFIYSLLVVPVKPRQPGRGGKPVSTKTQGLPDVSRPVPAAVHTQPLVLRMFSRRWILSSFLVIAAMMVMARLGVWQLDRLEKRRAFNARVLAQVNQPPILLSGLALDADLAGMEYRPVIVEGEYDHSQEVALRNQAWNDQIGVHLLTPLKVAGSDQAVLIDRGWVPVQDFDSHDWSQYTEPGKVRVQGVIRLSSSVPDFGRRADPPGRLDIWNFTNVERIASQVPYPMLTIYIQQAPDPSWSGLPRRSQSELDLTEGPHMGYAFQWFSFAVILGLGYPFFIRRQENARLRKMEQSYVDESTGR